MAEEILIDGVDVSGCYFAEISKTGSVACSQIDIRDCEGDIDLLLADCDEHPDCSYKQLKRLEQENKELKEKIIKLSEEKGHLIVENNTLKEENEGLKIKHQRYRECSMQLNKKYKSALEKILKSAKFAQCLPCGSGNLEDCLNCDDDTTNNGQFCMEKRIHEIKTKCVEVLGE